MRLNTLRILLCFIITVGVYSCKKAEVAKTPTPTPTPIPTPTPTGMTPQELNDSALYYTRDIYLWYNQIPATFSTASYADPSKLMEAIRQYSIEPGITSSADRWSFGIKK